MIPPVNSLLGSRCRQGERSLAWCGVRDCATLTAVQCLSLPPYLLPWPVWPYQAANHDLYLHWQDWRSIGKKRNSDKSLNLKTVVMNVCDRSLWMYWSLCSVIIHWRNIFIDVYREVITQDVIRAKCLVLRNRSGSVSTSWRIISKTTQIT